ncbi:hypothetical protein GGX14DRAFT_396144 [Mycena pura]|uniref:Uncharacterized protein n=1 Tax=Mycena pura TaxID=153505 RepID=A0AAD6VF43_9AGAR|nr:hypothetical protein GGX14DRAFT_396144 [Mycena pura]
MSFCSDDVERTRKEIRRHQDLLITLCSTLNLIVRERNWRKYCGREVQDQDVGRVAAGALVILHSLHALQSRVGDVHWGGGWITEFCKKQPDSNFGDMFIPVATFDDQTLLCVRVVERTLPLHESSFTAYAQVWWTSLHSLTAGRKLYFRSPQKERDELIQAILLPRYNRLQAEISSLSIFICPPPSPWFDLDVDQHHGAGSEALHLCLDVAGSLFKSIPVAGTMVESTCATLKKMLLAAEPRNKDGFGGAKEHAVVKQSGFECSMEANGATFVIRPNVTLHQIEQKLRKLGNLKLWKRVLNSADIQGKVQELKDILSHAYTKFNIQSHVTELQLLYDMRAIQHTTDARLEDMSSKIDAMLEIMTSGNGLSRQDAAKEGYIEEVEDDGETDLSGIEESVVNGKSTEQVKAPRDNAAGSTFTEDHA